MIRYGLKNLKWKNEIKNLKLRNKLKICSLNINFSKNINLNKTYLFFHLPCFWNLLMFDIKQCETHYLAFLYSKFYFFFLPFYKGKFNFYYDNQSKVFVVTNIFINNFFFLYWIIFKNIFYSFSKVFFKKLKFRGKGYYVYKNIRNTVATQFGYSHMIRIYGFLTSLKFITKSVIFVYGINKHDILNMGKKIYFKRPYNIFTGKGVRFSKQIIYKKTGKISSYR